MGCENGAWKLRHKHYSGYVYFIRYSLHTWRSKKNIVSLLKDLGIFPIPTMFVPGGELSLQTGGKDGMSVGTSTGNLHSMFAGAVGGSGSNSGAVGGRSSTVRRNLKAAIMAFFFEPDGRCGSGANRNASGHPSNSFGDYGPGIGNLGRRKTGRATRHNTINVTHRKMTIYNPLILLIPPADSASF